MYKAKEPSQEKERNKKSNLDYITLRSKTISKRF
jgi:hypothetical protein